MKSSHSPDAPFRPPVHVCARAIGPPAQIPSRTVCHKEVAAARQERRAIGTHLSKVAIFTEVELIQGYDGAASWATLDGEPVTDAALLHRADSCSRPTYSGSR